MFNLLKKYYVIFIILIIIVGIIVFLKLFSNDLDEKKNNWEEQKNHPDAYREGLPDCPKDLSGILTHSFIDLSYIYGLIPLGNSNPPSHTMPVDHVYYIGPTANAEDLPKIEFYAPGNGIITGVLKDTGYNESGEEVKTSYAITFAICNGLKVVSGGEGELVSKLKKAVENTEGKCNTINGKHEGIPTLKQCGYDLDYKVKAGELVGYTGDGEIIEVWAFNYNNKRKSDVNWSLYNYDDYGYAFCLFDLYRGDLKEKLYSKFGTYIFNNGKEGEHSNGPSRFVPRTIKPYCGEINVNILGAVQGDWFNLGKVTENLEPYVIELSLKHDNVDPMLGKIVIGENITNPGVGTFLPNHLGYINREFSEVVADGKIYCYEKNFGNKEIDAIDDIEHPSEFYIWQFNNQKILMELIDNTHLKIEVQEGRCTNNEMFINPYYYER